MAEKYGTSSHKKRDDTAFNPFQETVKVLLFVEQAGRVGTETFTVVVKNGCLEWTSKKLKKDYPGLIGTFDRAKLAVGLTTKQWTRLEEKIAKEMHKQRKEYR